MANITELNSPTKSIVLGKDKCSCDNQCQSMEQTISEEFKKNKITIIISPITALMSVRVPKIPMVSTTNGK